MVDTSADLTPPHRTGSRMPLDGLQVGDRAPELGEESRFGVPARNKLHWWKHCLEGVMGMSGQVMRYWNPLTDEIMCVGALDGLLGMGCHELRGVLRLWTDLIHPDEHGIFIRELNRSVAERNGFHCEYRLRKSNGAWSSVREHGYLMQDEQGEVVRVVSVIVDLSEQREMEARLRHSQKMETFGRLAGGVAHDFNNLLSVIIGYTQILNEDIGAEDPMRSHISEIEKAAFRAASLTNQLLAFSRQEMLKLSVLNLNDVLLDVGKMLRRLIGEQIKLILEPEDQLGWIRADHGQLEQVLINLAVNARDAMPDGGALTISTKNHRFATGQMIEGTEIPAGEYIQLTVADVGMGMSREVRDKIFEPYFTTKSPGRGTGLGLATCCGIIKQSGGAITVQSELGQGTNFQIFFPRVQKTDGKAGAAGDSRAPAKGWETILLVEDDSTVRGLAVAVLGRIGYKILEAADGEEALAILESNATTPVSMLITDVVMPKMGGIELAKRVERLCPSMSILFTSGYPDQSLDTAGLKSKFACFSKPFIPKALAAKVRSLLDGN